MWCSIVGKCQDILGSDEAYWVGQGCAGIIMPLLFSLVPSLRYTLSCLGIVFYGITSQAISMNNTIGGRILAGAIFLGSTITGGLIGFAIVSLSWMARGQGVESLVDISKQLDLPDLKEYLLVEGDFFRAVPLLYRDIEMVLEDNKDRVSSTYWILVIVLFAVMLLPWAWVRSMEENNLKIGMATMGSCLMSSLATFALVMPVTGQYMFWSIVFGGFVKASLVAMLGTFVSGFLIYVRSSHDELRKNLGHVLEDAGKTLSHVNSCFQESMQQVVEAKSFITLNKEDLVAVLDYDAKMRKCGSIKDYLTIMKELQDANLFISSCKAEPPIPGFASQWGANHELYMEVIKSTGDLLSQIGCLEVMFYSLRENLGGGQHSPEKSTNGLNQSHALEPRNLDAGMYMVKCLCIVCASITGVLHDCSAVLLRMPLFKKCSGNQLVWRPRPRGFWLEQYRILLDTLERDEVLKYFQVSGIIGIKDGLGSLERNTMPFYPGGSSLVFLTSIESLLDYSVTLEQRIAIALDITDCDRFDASDLHEMLRDSSNHIDIVKPGCKSSTRPTAVSSKGTSMMHQIRTSPILKGILLPFSIGTGFISLLVYVSACITFLRGIFSSLFLKRKRKKVTNTPESSDATRKIIYLVKFWTVVFLTMLGVILIGWLHIGNTPSSIYNAVELAKFLIKWQPMNVPLAVIICLTPTVNASIIKVFLRSAMIALGGALGFATMLNGILAQNPYFVFFIATSVNGFFCIFSSIGTTARYSLFLVLYTYFSVVACQYSGQCCKAGDVWEFAGRTITTIIGACLALVSDWLVFPVYSSQIIFSQEEELFASNIDTIASAVENGPNILTDKLLAAAHHTYKSEMNDITSADVALVSLYKLVSERTSSSFQTRLALVKDILTERHSNSLENWRFFFFNVTMLPLPFACKLVFVRVTSMGIQINVCLHALKSSVYNMNQGLFQHLFFSKMMVETKQLFDCTKELSIMIGNNLLQSSRENDQTQTKMLSTLNLIFSIRSRLLENFNSITDALESMPVGQGDLKCLAYYQYLLASLDQVHRLAQELCMDERTKIRDTYLTFLLGIARKDEFWKEFRL